MSAAAGTPGVDEPVARWEIWSFAQMLIATHADGAEEKAELEIALARDSGDTGQMTVWAAVRSRLEEIRGKEREGS
jgi:hypothetical protein